MLNGPALASCPLFKSPFQPPPLHMHAKLSLGGAFDFLKTNRHDVLVLNLKKILCLFKLVFLKKTTN